MRTSTACLTGKTSRSVGRGCTMTRTISSPPRGGCRSLWSTIMGAGPQPHSNLSPRTGPLENEWALAQYLGYGVVACYQGYKLYDSPVTLAMVKKWVDFYKQYCDILISNIVHLRRPDMQGDISRSVSGIM